MDSNRLVRPRTLLACVTLLLTTLVMSAPAHAQYSWIDERGTHVFSDRPPPPGTPPARILRTPRYYALPAPAAPAPSPGAAGAPPAAGAGTAANAAPAGAAVPSSLADRDAGFRKRMAQRDADERKAAEDARNKAALAEQCAGARRSAAALGSGARLTDIDEKGERIVLTDEEKAKRLAHAQRALADCR